jgi:hypothetical protein
MFFYAIGTMAFLCRCAVKFLLIVDIPVWLPVHGYQFASCQEKEILILQQFTSYVFLEY